MYKTKDGDYNVHTRLSEQIWLQLKEETKNKDCKVSSMAQFIKYLVKTYRPKKIDTSPYKTRTSHLVIAVFSPQECEDLQKLKAKYGKSNENDNRFLRNLIYTKLKHGLKLEEYYDEAKVTVLVYE